MGAIPDLRLDIYEFKHEANRQIKFAISPPDKSTRMEIFPWEGSHLFITSTTIKFLMSSIDFSPYYNLIAPGGSPFIVSLQENDSPNDQAKTCNIVIIFLLSYLS